MAQTKALLSKPLQHMEGSPAKRPAYLGCEFSITDIDKLDRSLGQPDVNSSIYLKNIATNPFNDGYVKYPSVTGLLNLRVSICGKSNPIRPLGLNNKWIKMSYLSFA